MILISFIISKLMNNQKYLKVAVKAAKDAGKIFRRYFGKPKEVKMKGGDPRNLVTEIDYQIERIINTKIKKTFPDHCVMGEEFGWQDNKSKGIYRWYVDPIDGTSNYVQGLKLTCISIALWDGAGPLVAVVFDPVGGEMYTAVRGKGAYLNGKRIHVSKISKVSEGFGCIGWVERENGVKLFKKIIMRCRKVRGLATSALQTSMVGIGILDFYVTRDLHVWDFAAAALIVREAGGRVTDFAGKPINAKSHSIIASNGKIHKELLKIIR